ncbi:MAG: uroporphyrinogen-III C-methyltransferase, partial [Firmicutes bacterium]|nr:uroporphyrinogen-III C-methyltransferase [Bacillota bacterium]
PDAELIYVGKQANRHTMTQDQINEVLVEKALEGKIVTRLKGGDPYIFGRGGEEAEYCRKHGVKFEVVPGITSAISAPAYAGIPLTHRGYASSVSIITGHEDPTKETSALNWEKLATATDTLVFLMGMSNLAKIVEKLITYGRPADTPVALVRWGTTTKQEVLEGTLETIVEKVQSTGFKSPAIIVVGEVVKLRPTLRWFEDKPLFGKRIVVTRARAQASALTERLMSLGAEPLECPTIKISEPDSYEPVDAAIEGLAQGYDWIVFTSVNGVEYFLDRLFVKGKDIRALGEAKLAAIGTATAGALRRRGLRVDFIPTEYRAEGLLAGFPTEEVSGKKVLIPRALEARTILPEELKRRGAKVLEVPVYKTVLDESEGETLVRELSQGQVDAITFTSSSTVKNFLTLLTKAGGSLDLIKGVTIACIGPITAETTRAAGISVDLEADEYTIDGLVESLIEYFAQ